jgi:hypothetical protein
MKNTVLLCMLLIVFNSCRKDQTTTPEVDLTTPIEKLQNNWTWNYNIDYNYVGASTTPDYNDTLTIAGDYINFKTDNTADIRIGGQTDNVAYSLISDSVLMFDGDTFVINKLTDYEFQFTYSERTAVPYFDNVNTLTKQ